MAPPVSHDRGRGGSHGLTPTANPFTPKHQLVTKPEALDITFVTQKLPPIHRYAAIIGLCTVPEERAGMTDLGWHISDFLAFRALLCGPNPPQAQTWLSMCDIGSIVQDHPNRYFHGKDKRLVGAAATKVLDYHNDERVDNIQVETDGDMLKAMFIQAIRDKLSLIKRRRYPLVLIACGLTSLEQDIYFGEVDMGRRLTLSELRHSLGNALDGIQVIVITPSLFSAGWQISVSFGYAAPTPSRLTTIELLARQLGGLFAKGHVHHFFGWDCPALEGSGVDPDTMRRETFPGPALPPCELKQLITTLQTKIQSHLVGRLGAHPLDHSFSFYKADDEWEAVMGWRKESNDFKGLDWYERIWLKLPKAEGTEAQTIQGFEFLGNAFGGNMLSQLYHMKSLIQESYLAWPDHWASSFGKEIMKELERFKAQQTPNYVNCQEMFNVLEHRATTSVLADTVIRLFDLPAPSGQRCREWDQVKWKTEAPDTVKSCVVKKFGTVLGWIPGPNVPPGVNENSLSKLQRRLENGVTYIRASLSMKFSADDAAGKHASNMIDSCKCTYHP
ncbi:hypothetical protein F5Y17DRAFT_180607 [Xylariaceae sp. FL0594]|nr:hypothetical protein F5Y17DRAFT_180607 [Xylariaceae sp. FL0594]